MELIRKIKHIAYHRNGVHGTSFYTVLFSGTGRDEKEMIATVFDTTRNLDSTSTPSENKEKEILIAVVNVDDIRNGKIERKYRGDNYEWDLFPAIQKWENDRVGKW